MEKLANGFTTPTKRAQHQTVEFTTPAKRIHIDGFNTPTDQPVTVGLVSVKSERKAAIDDRRSYTTPVHGGRRKVCPPAPHHR